MKKRFYLWAVLFLLGTAGVYGQMWIGSSEAPEKSAVLDLNPDNRTGEGNTTRGLALPRVVLKHTADAYPLLSHVHCRKYLPDGFS
jgi:hypothetical protein